MRFINAKFVKSASKKGDFIHDEKPQVAIVGRSNVGKSSLINMLTNNSKLAKTSKTPGRTRLVNYFIIDEKFYLVDLPGYGYNVAGKNTSADWDRLMGDYFDNNQQLKVVLLLLDARREASPLDISMLDYLAEKEVPALIVLTKSDKISRSDLNNRIKKLSADLRYNKDRIVSTSSAKKIGAADLGSKLDEFLS